LPLPWTGLRRARRCLRLRLARCYQDHKGQSERHTPDRTGEGYGCRPAGVSVSGHENLLKSEFPI
jgi:hypothetical protein